ncbi:hypothetical protein FRC00_003089, partial [Tulasnella sp. 408]
MEGAANTSSSTAGPSVPKPAESSKDKPPQRGPPPGEKKVLTKAERREIQEAQRAAKEVAKAQAAAGKGGGGGGKGKQAPAPQKKPPAAAGPSRIQSDANIAAFHHPKSTAAPSIETASTAPPPETLLRIFSHFALPKPLPSLGSGIKGDIHPVIRKLGLQFADFRIVGANARCIAALTAFKTVIQDYQTPAGTTLSRHLMTYLSPQISYMTAARPQSMSTGNAIRYLKSSVVEKAILAAWDAGRRFNVVVIDSRPLLEGKALLASLTSAAIPATYALLSSLPSLLPTVKTVILGAHALHANGSLYSRAGTAIVAMMAKSHQVPVIVCCETYKFSDTVLLDSFMKNEIAPNSTTGLSDTDRSLQALSPLYDLTPHTNITAVVTEVGLIPATAVPTVVARSFQGSIRFTFHLIRVSRCLLCRCRFTEVVENSASPEIRSFFNRNSLPPTHLFVTQLEDAMGVPALFRFLQRKYPKIILPVEEEGPDPNSLRRDPTTGETMVDITTPNPNGVEFDNLYLDMNGIVHPCTHPEGRPAPETEEDMMVEVFRYTDRVVNMVRPRKLLFMAIDGVAPRAKMNQQRSRRFRSVKDAEESARELQEAIVAYEALGHTVSDDIKNKKSWDSNAITPGTPFMSLLAASLRYWVSQKMNSDPGWKD